MESGTRESIHFTTVLSTFGVVHSALDSQFYEVYWTVWAVLMGGEGGDRDRELTQTLVTEA